MSAFEDNLKGSSDAETRLRQELRKLAQTDPNAFSLNESLNRFVKQFNSGKKIVQGMYDEIRETVIEERQPPPPPPKEPTEEEKAAIEAEAKAKEVEAKEREEDQEKIDKRAQEIASSKDIPSLFHVTLLKHCRYVADLELSTSVLFSQLARKRNNSAHYLIVGGSGSGKTELIDKAAECLPPEDVKRLTSGSAMSLYYMGDVRGKYIIGGELKLVNLNEDDPYQQAARQLVSDNKISREIPERDEDGKMVNRTYVTEGPAVLINTTTAEVTSLNDEMVNRASLVQTDESEETTAKVLSEQAAAAKRSLTPAQTKDRQIEIEAWRKFHREMQPLDVEIPYSELIIPSSRAVTVRRLFPMLLGYISLSALLHQSNRTVDTTVTAEFEDYARAHKLLMRNAPRTNDPLGDKAREFFGKLQDAFKEASFTRAKAQREVKCSKQTAQRYLSALKDAGCVSETGQKEGRAPTYKTCGELPEKEDPGFVTPDELKQKLEALSHPFEPFDPGSNPVGQGNGLGAFDSSTQRPGTPGEKHIFEEVR